MDRNLSRRALLRRGTLGAAALGAAAGGLGLRPTPVGQAQAQPAPHEGDEHGAHSMQSVVGDVGPNAIGIDPMAYLTTFDYGKASTLPDGRTLREWQIVAVDREIEVAPGVFFPAWAYNGQVPGPTLRCSEGDLLRIEFVNAGSHPHTIHFHGFHPPRMDGFDPMVPTGGQFTYEFTARPFGLHPYHCHSVPLKKHIHKGLYGCLVIDPPGGRAPAKEFVMIMNGFDTNFDGENEIYAVNSIAFYYQKHPIRVRRGEPLRVYLTNLTEFDPINSFHLHAGMFKLFRTGTQLDHHEFTDIVMMCQGERAVLEFTLDELGLYMFHAHQSELAELGWMGFFESVDEDVAALPAAPSSAAASFSDAALAPALCRIDGAS